MVTAKRIVPAAINALKEALTNVYWYKSDLRSFIMNTISDPSILARLDWSDYKRNIVTVLIDFLSRNQNTYQNDLLRLMSEITKIDDLSHLARLEDGVEKVKKAKESINALRGLVEDHFDMLEEQRLREEQRKTGKSSRENKGSQGKEREAG